MLVGMKKDYSELEQVLNTARFHQGHLHCGAAVIWFLELIAVILKRPRSSSILLLIKAERSNFKQQRSDPGMAQKQVVGCKGLFLDWALNLPLAFT